MGPEAKKAKRHRDDMEDDEREAFDAWLEEVRVKRYVGSLSNLTLFFLSTSGFLPWGHPPSKYAQKWAFLTHPAQYAL